MNRLLTLIVIIEQILQFWRAGGGGGVLGSGSKIIYSFKQPIPFDSFGNDSTELS